ncbi:MAG: Gfo/Idh/MocA family protein [Candidatus Dormibacteria bacterium]
MGAAWISDVAMAEAIRASRNGHLVAVASRDRSRAEGLAARHGIPRVHDSYEEVLTDPGVGAVYIPLVNSLHREWTLRALSAGKHVLCEKPLAMNAAEAGEMAAAAEASGLLLMEALMYRFHPRIRATVESLPRPRLVQAGFGFGLSAQGDNYRRDPALGGGALLDVGCYVVSIAQWILGEPSAIAATAHRAGGLDTSVAISLGFPDGALASLWASFETAENQELLVLDGETTTTVSRPFTAHRDPHDPYQMMAEAFADAVQGGGPAPLPPSESIANMRTLDGVRAAIDHAAPRHG